MSNTVTEKIQTREKSAFFAVNFGSGLVSGSVSTFSLYYFTDVLLLPAGALSVLLLVVRLFDGFVDPFLGHYMDKRTTRFGKYKGYLYYWTPVLCLLYVALFLPPPLTGWGRLFWIFVVYLLFSGAYSVTEVARHPLLVTITQNKRERQLLNSYKIAGGIAAALVVQYLLLNLVGMLGGGSEQRGFARAAALFAVAAAVCILTGARFIKERHITPNSELSLRQTLLAILHSRRLLFVMLMILMDYVGTAIKSQTAIYYMKYFVGRQDLTPLFLLIGVGSSLLMQPVIVWAARRVPIIRLIVAGCAGSVVGMLLIGFADTSLPVLMAGNVVFGVSSAFPANLILLHTANLSDAFSRERGASFNGVVNSIIGLSSRIALSIAGAMISLVLFLVAYEPNVEQSAAALVGIQVIFVLLTCLAYLGVALFAVLSGRGEAREM